MRVGEGISNGTLGQTANSSGAWGEKEQAGVTNSSWDELRKVEFAGNVEPQREQQESEKDREAAVQEIRTLTDWRAKAERMNPDGLQEAIAKDTAINTAKEHDRQKIYDGLAQYKELFSASDERTRREKELKSLREEKSRNKLYRLKQKLGIQDQQMLDWQQEIDELEEQSQRMISLVCSGYSDEDSTQKRIAAIGGDTHEHEEGFIDSFVAPLEKEQKQELLKFDNLAKLSTREYFDLWKGLNPYYLSHVTRQGYRDHTGMVYHTAGLGEFHDGFKQIMQGDKKLHSTWETVTGQGMSSVNNDEVVNKYFNSEPMLADLAPETEGELDETTLAAAIGAGHNILSQPDGYWQDKTSIHFMANAVGNNLYGAENGNEVFFIFPADVLASQCYSNKTPAVIDEKASRHGKPPSQGDYQFNDYGIMPRENGIPLDAGLVFLPKNIFVNPENGSKYQKYDAKNPIYADEEHGVRAEQYWEQYFAQHPELKPAHVIYYDGNPADAVNKILEKEGIVVGGAGDLAQGKTVYDCGFNEHITHGETEAGRQVAAERETFFKKMAEYVTNKH